MISTWRLGALFVAAAVTLTGCGTTTDGSSSGTTPAATTAAASVSASPTAAAFTPATSGELSLYTWSDYFPASMVKRFKAETGIDLKVSYYDSNETLEAKLKASNGTGYDLVVPTDYMVANLIKEGLLKEFDATTLPNGKNMAPEFVDVYFDKGRKYSVPYLYGTTGYGYDSTVITTPMTTWKDFFSAPAAAKGKIGIFNDQTDVVTAALRAVGGEPCSTDPAKLQAAQDLLVAFKSKVATVSSEGNLDRLASGENTLGMVWNGAFHRAKAKNSKLTYVYPADGTVLWQDNFTMPSGAKNIPQALTFLNWYMDPKNAAEAANFQGYSGGYSGIADFLDAGMKSDPAVVIPEADKAHVAPVPPCDTTATNAYSKIFEKFRS